MHRSFLFNKTAFLSLIACMVGAASLQAEQQVLNGLAAVVNDDVITFSQVRELVGAQESQIMQQYKDQPAVMKEKIIQTRMAAVNELIDRQLILQEFKKMQAKGASIPDYVLEDHIKTIINGPSFKGDRAAFIRTLDAQGFTLARFKELEMEKIIVSGMRARQAKSDLIVPPKDVEAYYAAHREEFSTPDEVKLRMISLKKEGATDATQKALAEEIRQKVSAGADFSNMAQLYSSLHAQEGGDWGWITRKDINETLTKVAFALKPGQISNPVDSEGSYWLIFVEARKNGGTKSFNEVRDDIEKKLLQVEQQKQQEKWIAGLRAKAYIKTF